MDLTLERIYGWREMSTAIARSVLKEVHLRCTKSVQFTFDDSIYLQYVGIEWDQFLLGAVLAGIVMFGLETKVVSTISNHI